MTWIRVLLPYACFGIAVRDGRVVDAAPIAAWAIGKPERQVADFYRRKGGTFTRLGSSTKRHSALLESYLKATG